MANESPLVSVIVPMYNTEQYIAELLNSCLSQTLKNFELIIVDNGSTDNSGKIVEGYIDKFSGRLKLVKIAVNNGLSPARNLGLEMSRGKYIFFADSDDAISTTALEQMYHIAENFQADVVHCKRNFSSTGFGQDFINNMRLEGNPSDNNFEIVTGDFPTRVRAWMQSFFGVTLWTKFLSRDFLVKNQIKCLPIIQEDSIWTFELICLAEKIVMAPIACYCHRERNTSLTAEAFERTLNVKTMHYKMDRIIRGIKDTDKFMDRIGYFNEHPEFRYEVLSHILMQNLNWTLGSYADYPPHVIYENLKAAFSKEMGEHDVLISCLVSNCIWLIKNLVAQQKLVITPPRHKFSCRNKFIAAIFLLAIIYNAGRDFCE